MKSNGKKSKRKTEFTEQLKDNLKNLEIRNWTTKVQSRKEWKKLGE